MQKLDFDFSNSNYFLKEKQMAFRNLGNVGAVPQIRKSFSVSSFDTTDVFAFTVQDARSINVAVTNVAGPGLTPTSGSGLSLNLYRDNGNGVLDGADELIRTSSRVGNNDELIGIQQPTGIYFAEVARNRVETNAVLYDFAVSATRFEPPNLFASNRGNLGNLFRDETDIGFVSDNRTTHNTEFFLGSDDGVNIRLTGLSGNANMRLIKDLDFDQVIDTNEVIRTSSNSGTSSESILNVQGRGNYLLQIHQPFAGVKADGQLTFDHFSVG
jgi:hypothetical protein